MAPVPCAGEIGWTTDGLRGCVLFVGCWPRLPGRIDSTHRTKRLAQMRAGMQARRLIAASVRLAQSAKSAACVTLPRVSQMPVACIYKTGEMRASKSSSVMNTALDQSSLVFANLFVASDNGCFVVRKAVAETQNDVLPCLFRSRATNSPMYRTLNNPTTHMHHQLLLRSFGPSRRPFDG